MIPYTTRLRSAGGGAESSPDAHWKQLTRIANSAFADGDYGAARAHYLEAIHEAESLFEAAANGSGWTDAAALLMVAHANLAELLIQTGERVAGRNCCQSGLERLLAVVCDADVNADTQAFRAECYRQLNPALQEFLHYQSTLPARDRSRGELVVARVRLAATTFAREASQCH
ncbi:MAG: hypothetical protein AAF184_06640 [Pseudomonadota bacterium]